MQSVLSTNSCDCSLPQNEKKMSLTQQENNKIKERDEQHTQELRVWRADLAKTKQVSWAAWDACVGEITVFPH